MKLPICYIPQGLNALWLFIEDFNMKKTKINSNFILSEAKDSVNNFDYSSLTQSHAVRQLERINIKELDEILEKHRKYIAMEEGGECADLSFKIIQYGNFGNLNLTDANFFNSILCGMNFDCSILVNTNFEKTDLRYSIMDRSDLSNSNLTSTNFSESSLIRTILRGAKISGINFYGANLHETQF